MQKQLRQLPHFGKVDLKTIKELISAGQITKRFYHKGETVHEQNTRCCGIDIVRSGKLIAYSLAPNGSETVVFEFQKDSIIGANLLFGDQNNYPMNIYCTRDSTIFHITKQAIIQLLNNYDFVLSFVKSLSLNSQGLNRRIAMYTQKSLRENIIDYLKALSISQGSQIITLPTTKKQLADYFGVQRPSLFRELKRMKDEGLIEIDNATITMLFV